MPSYGGAHGPDGSKKSGDQGQGSRDSKGGQTGGSRGGGLGSADQRHVNRLAEINRVAKATGTSATPVGNSGVSKAGRVSSALQGMGRDYRNTGNSTMDNIGNRIASMLGFNEQRPTMTGALDRVAGTPAGQATDNRAGWGFDPAGLIGGAVGMGFGVPGLGLATDWISRQFNRPLEIGMGPSVFGGGPSYGGGTPAGNGGMVNTASGSRGFGGQQAGGGTGNGALGNYSPFRTHTTGNPNVSKPMGTTQPQQTAQPGQNMWAKPWPGSQSYSPFGNGSWAGWG